MGSQEVLILLDSRSAGTFVSPDIAAKIQQEQQYCEPLKFSAADGNLLLSDKIIPQMQWQIQGHIFQHDTRCFHLKAMT